MAEWSRRHYLMCRPAYFTVSYEINPWMDTTVPVDVPRAIEQWEYLRDVYRDLGHTVDEIDPEPGLPDMVFAANGATVVDGLVYSAKFRHPERAAEAPVYLKWFADRGYVTYEADRVNEGEGDLLLAGERVLAGFGFRTERAAHDEARALWKRELVSLELADPRYYHLDTALTVLNGADGTGAAEIAYLPRAFSPASQEILSDLFPDAVLADDEDAAVLGLNAVSDGRHVVHSPKVVRLAGQLAERGYETISVDTSELLRAGGGAKCCTLAVRGRGARAGDTTTGLADRALPGASASAAAPGAAA
ncbi:N-dimethylarginine dimethylaminohydrolase [Antribacter sp. KLBMP9083]|uniref:N-dimethylarginine dimethylaminohydrolase n=1 Tax=Antribacter soli TaxID=2910976 RepID=A0AA41QFN4_9MICO|nr:dimethylargininase [Antribacter soli]MCF4122261.1 N-dimethylarginine dimethylaminohydrolase [Antribacter soli]